jgi:hypothetical protein
MPRPEVVEGMGWMGWGGVWRCRVEEVLMGIRWGRGKKRRRRRRRRGRRRRMLIIFKKS